MSITFMSVAAILAAMTILLPITGVLISFIIGAVTAFVWRSDIPNNFVLNLFIKRIPSGIYVDKIKYNGYDTDTFVIQDGSGSIRDVRHQVWQTYVDRDCLILEEERANSLAGVLKTKQDRYVNYFWVIFPMALVILAIGAALQYMFWFTVYTSTLIGSLFVLRWICDLHKYARKVKESLDSHKADPQAHQKVPENETKSGN